MSWKMPDTKDSEPSPILGIILNPPKTAFEIVSDIVQRCAELCAGLDVESQNLSVASCLYGIEKLGYELGREDIATEAQSAIEAMRARL